MEIFCKQGPMMCRANGVLLIRRVGIDELIYEILNGLDVYTRMFVQTNDKRYIFAYQLYFL